MADPSTSITLTQLNYFHRLAETRHFTEAARQLYITQPTLSASIKSLENELGVSLIFREGRRNVRLTRYGEEFNRRITPILEELKEAIDSVSARGIENEHPLRIGTIATVQYDYLPSVLQGYWDIRGYDRNVRISVEFTGSLVKGLRDQVFDVVFCARVPEETDFEFVPVVATSAVAVVHKEGPYAHLASLNLADLDKMPFTTYRDSTTIGREMKALLDSSGKKLEPMISFDDEFALAGYVQASVDVVGLMTDTFEIGPFKDDVNVIPIDGVERDWHPICMAYDPRLIQSDALKTLVQVAKERSPLLAQQ